MKTSVWIKSVCMMAAGLGVLCFSAKAAEKKGMECCMMKDGKMMVMEGDKCMPMEKEMTMKDGMKVMPNGTCVSKDGTKMEMKEGMMVRGDTLMMTDCAVMCGGKMMKVMDGKCARMKEEMTMKDGTKVMPDGTATRKDGATEKFEDGKVMSMDGKVMTQKQMGKMLEQK